MNWITMGRLMRRFVLAFDQIVPQCSQRQRQYHSPTHSSSLSLCSSLYQDDSKRWNSSNLSPSSRAWLQRQQKDPYVLQAQKDGSPSRAMYKLQQMDTMVYDFRKGKMAMDRKRRRLSTDNNNINLVENDKKQTQQPQGLFQRGHVVIELGASPGGWTLYASKRIGEQGFIIACDLLELDKMCLQSIQDNTKVQVIYGDFTSSNVKRQIVTALENWNSQRRKLRKEEALDTAVEHTTDDSQKMNGTVDCVISDMAVNFTGDRSTDALRTLNLCEDALNFAIGHDDCIDDPPLLRKGGTFLCKFFPCGTSHEKELLERTKKMFQYTTFFKPAASRKESSEKYLYAGDYLGNRLYD